MDTCVYIKAFFLLAPIEPAINTANTSGEYYWVTLLGIGFLRWCLSCQEEMAAMAHFP